MAVQNEEQLAMARKAAEELGTVSAESLTSPVKRVTVSEPVQATEPNMDMVSRVQDSLTFDVNQYRENQKQQQELLAQQQALAGEGTLSELYTDLQKQYDIPQNMRTLMDIQNQIADIKTESLGTQSDIARATGQTVGQASREISAEKARENVRSYGLAARASILQGNIETATTLVNQAVQTVYQDRTLRNTNLINQINSLKGVVDSQTEEILNKEQRKYEEEQADIERVQSAIDTAVSSGAATAEQIQTLTQAVPDKIAGESEQAYTHRLKKFNEQQYQTALSVVANKARQDYNLERAIKGAQYELLGIEIDSANAKAAQAAEDAVSGKLTPDQFEVATDLRTEYNNKQEVKDAKDLEASTASLISALDQSNGVGDISAINSFQRLVVDPGVAVREGDVALLQSAQSWADIAWLKAQGLWKGDKLTPEARTQMEELVKDVYRIRVELVDMNTEQIRTLAKEQDIDFGKYIGRNFQTFEQLKASSSNLEFNIFGNDTESYLDTAVSALATDPSTNPFGVTY